MSPEFGDTVRVHYVGRKMNGDVFDTSRETAAEEAGILEPDRPYQPLELTVGENQVIEGFEAAVADMAVGETRTVEIAPAAAYGRKMADRVIEYGLEEFDDALADEKDPEVGMEIESENGIRGELIDIGDDYVRVDFNHELAGERLEFEIELLEVVEA